MPSAPWAHQPGLTAPPSCEPTTCCSELSPLPLPDSDPEPDPESESSSLSLLPLPLCVPSALCLGGATPTAVVAGAAVRQPPRSAGDVSSSSSSSLFLAAAVTAAAARAVAGAVATPAAVRASGRAVFRSSMAILSETSDPLRTMLALAPTASCESVDGDV